MLQAYRHLHVIGGNGTPKTVTFEGREHLVVPVVALREGVFHAVNSKTPEYVTPQFLSEVSRSFNGRPCVIAHPVRAGEHISANSPDVVDASAFGKTYNARVVDGRLMMDAYVDPERLKALNQLPLLEALKNGERIEVSVGAMVGMGNRAGTFNGKPYQASWIAGMGDHLAFLPGGRGACSVEAGCGANRAASAYRVAEDGAFEPVAKPTKVEQSQSQSLKDRVKALMAAFRPMAPGDSPEAQAAEEAGELAYYSTMQTILAGVGDQYDQLEDLIDSLVDDEVENPTTTPGGEMAEERVETARLDTIKSLCQSMAQSLMSIQSLSYAVCEPDMPEPGSPRYAKALRAAAGKRHSEKDLQMLQQVHDHSVNLGAECASMKAAEGHPCGCQGESTMEKEAKAALVKALAANEHSQIKNTKVLEALSDDELTALDATVKAAATKATELKAASDAAAAKTTQLQTENEQLKAAAAAPVAEDRLPADLRGLLSRARAAEDARKTELVTSLKAAQSAYTEDELKAMTIEQLEKTAQLAKVAVGDFAGRGTPRVAAGNDGDQYKAPDSWAPKAAAGK